MRDRSFETRLSRFREIRIEVMGRRSGRTVALPVWFVGRVGEILQDGQIDPVLGKALRVLPETELVEPMWDLARRCLLTPIPRAAPRPRAAEASPALR
jgi:hypothetical protein